MLFFFKLSLPGLTSSYVIQLACLHPVLNKLSFILHILRTLPPICPPYLYLQITLHHRPFHCPPLTSSVSEETHQMTLVKHGEKCASVLIRNIRTAQQ